MTIKSALVQLATKVPPPVGPLLLRLLIGTPREIPPSAEEARFTVLRTCQDLEGSATAMFQPETMKDVFGVADLRVILKLRRALGDDRGEEFRIGLEGDGSVIVQRKDH